MAIFTNIVCRRMVLGFTLLLDIIMTVITTGYDLTMIEAGRIPGSGFMAILTEVTTGCNMIKIFTCGLNAIMAGVTITAYP